ncbi:MAG TPA: hypothetical protein VHS09_03765 [Polyangiaceae bacterium]|jgi:hypothetical protein|nr:hypothetical protein [Polyangiaceae bacterium]
MAFELATRQRAVVRALGGALFAHADGPRPEQLDALVDGFERHLGPVSAVQRTLILLAVDLVRWLPVLLFVAARPFEDLSVDRRLALLERMDRSHFTVLLMPLIAFKSLLAMYFFEDPSELRAMGYPGDERKRWLKIAA